MQAFNRWIANRKFRELIGEAKRRGAAAGKFGVDDKFSSWAEAMVRPVVYIEYGPPGAAPVLLAERRQKLETKLEVLPTTLPSQEQAQVSVSYPLAAVVLLSGALTGLVLDLSGLRLGPTHWAAVAVSSVWLTAVLHVLPVGLRACARLFQVVAVRRKVAQFSREIAELELAEVHEQRLADQRAHSNADRVEVLVQTFDFYRSAGRAATALHYQAAA